MDEREMKTGVIPLRHSSLPGHVKLPRRYEKAAMGTNGIPTRVRKISIQPGSSALGDSLSDRLDDLMSAMMWVKQELIMLRQHDILLKRQFFNIQHSIKSLQKPKSTTPSSISPAATATTNTSTTSSNSTSSTHHPIPNGDAIIEETDTELDSRIEAVSSYINTDNNNNSSSSRHSSHDNSDFPMDTYVVRPSSSVTMLHEESEEEEDADTFAEEFFCRPRTSSMRTSRDMAALARRRGSKELI
ncbi:uncharacterized protein [Littorina saxatilis]|uniref:Uncharacterized protein n=2 Tax=Littorina saxatilis TaxID=31220 RepID=A0AAN9B6A0_9CAEN